MNLATRCTTCGTIFRVVQDQLRVSEGWVRCGRCAEVFDAREQLFDLERDSPPPWPPLSPAAEPPPPVPAAPTRRVAPEPPYQPYQGAFQPSQPARLAPAPVDTRPPVATPPAAPAPRFQPEAPRFEPEPPRFAAEPTPFYPEAPAIVADGPRTPAPRGAGRDSWLANDDDELNPFAPRHLPEPDVDEDDGLYAGAVSRFGLHDEDERDFAIDAPDPGPSRFTDSRIEPSLDDRREPFIDPPAPMAAPAPDPRAHLPEPKGMRFEEDELPPPVIDDERPDVLLALSPATAAQIDSQQPGLDDDDPLMGDSTTLETPAERKARLKAEKAQAKAAAKAAKAAAKAKARQGKSPAETSMMDTVAPVPSFMRQAESARRWQQPGMRLALGGGAAALTLLLMGQGVWHGRAAIAAQYPGTRPALASFSSALGDELRPWQHIEALSVESSSLNPAGSGNQYRLSLSLRNRSNWEVAQPWVDLSLTDAAGQLVVRRMLSPAEMQVARTALPAGADQQMQVVFDSGPVKISGYTVELFYPQAR